MISTLPQRINTQTATRSFLIIQMEIPPESRSKLKNRNQNQNVHIVQQPLLDDNHVAPIRISRFQVVKKKLVKVMTNLTIEPAVLLFTVAMAINGISTQSLIIRKYCLIEMNYSEAICTNLTNNKKLEEKAQTLATDFVLYKVRKRIEMLN
uniref:Uncharacterized protein n=1 Tax=Strigamia maritima TaxID=126957 RepID=T1J6Z2_STRMM